MSYWEAIYCLSLAIVCMICVWVSRASYRNGVTDGYGYSQEPGCPGYLKAGRILRETMSHRWSELQQREEG